MWIGSRRRWRGLLWGLAPQYCTAHGCTLQHFTVPRKQKAPAKCERLMYRPRSYDPTRLDSRVIPCCHPRGRRSVSCACDTHPTRYAMTVSDTLKSIIQQRLPRWAAFVMHYCGAFFHAFSLVILSAIGLAASSPRRLCRRGRYPNMTASNACWRSMGIRR